MVCFGAIVVEPELGSGSASEVSMSSIVLGQKAQVPTAVAEFARIPLRPCLRRGPPVHPGRPVQRH